MANIKSSKKRVKIARKKTAENKSQKSELSTFIKKYKAAPTAELLSKVTCLLDKAVSSNIIHINKASRTKAKLSKLVPAPVEAPTAAAK